MSWKDTWLREAGLLCVVFPLNLQGKNEATRRGRPVQRQNLGCLVSEMWAPDPRTGILYKSSRERLKYFSELVHILSGSLVLLFRSFLLEVEGV